MPMTSLTVFAVLAYAAPVASPQGAILGRQCLMSDCRNVVVDVGWFLYKTVIA